MRVIPSLLLFLPRVLLATLLLAGLAFPATFLFSSPAMADDGGGGADGCSGNSSSDCGNNAGNDNAGGCGTCDGAGYSGGDYDGGGSDTDGDKGSSDWGGSDDGGYWGGDYWVSEYYWPSFSGSTSGCVIQSAYSDGLGHRVDSTFTPNWRVCH